MSNLNLASSSNFLLINKKGSATLSQSSLSDKMFLLLLLALQADHRQKDQSAEHRGYSRRKDLVMTTTSARHSG